MIRFGIIGFGNIGHRHAHYIEENPETQLIAIHDIDAEAMKKAALLDVTTYQSYEAMLANPDIDVVCVCTPNYLHATHSISALNAGKHVLCEKPMCMKVSEADAMIEAAGANDRQIFVVKQNRYNTPVKWVKELIEEQRLGEIFQVSVRCFWNRNERYYQQSAWRGDLEKDGGCIYTQFSHFVDIMYYLLGDLEAVFGESQNKNHPYINTEDQGAFLLRTADDARVVFQYSTSAYEQNMEGSLTLLAENGSVQIGGKYLNQLTYSKVDGKEMPEADDDSENNTYSSGYEGTMSHHDYVIQNVVDTLKGKDTAMTSAEEGRAVVSIIERMYALVR